MSALRLAALAVLAAGCKAKASPAECEALVDRYAELVVREATPDAAPTAVAREQDRVRSEARAEGVFKNCASEVEASRARCAMKAKSTEALEECLE